MKFCYRRSGEDAKSFVLEMAYATHMCCLMSWNKIYCVYPWSLSEKDTWILTCLLTKLQRQELDRWIRDVGSRDVILESKYVGSAVRVPDCKQWIISLRSCVGRLRQLKRFVNLSGFCEMVLTL